MADSFRLIAPRGLVVTKQDWVERSASVRTAQHDSVTYDHVHVHLYGDYAVLSGNTPSAALLRDRRSLVTASQCQRGCTTGHAGACWLASIPIRLGVPEAQAKS